MRNSERSIGRQVLFGTLFGTLFAVWRLRLGRVSGNQSNPTQGGAP